MVFGSGDPSEVQISSSGSADLSPSWVHSPPQTVQNRGLRRGTKLSGMEAISFPSPSTDAGGQEHETRGVNKGSQFDTGMFGRDPDLD